VLLFYVIVFALHFFILVDGRLACVSLVCLCYSLFVCSHQFFCFVYVLLYAMLFLCFYVMFLWVIIFQCLFSVLVYCVLSFFGFLAFIIYMCVLCCSNLFLTVYLVVCWLCVLSSFM